MAFRNPITSLPGSAITGPINGAQLTPGSVAGTALAADSIDGKTITGAVIRTSATVPKIELNSASNTLTAEDGTSWAALTTNRLQFGGYNPNTGAKWAGGAASITGALNTLVIAGAGDTTSGGTNFSPRLTLDAGVVGAPKSQLTIESQTAGTPADISLTGNILRTGSSWQSVGYGTGWSDAPSGIAGLGGTGLRIHQMPDDTLWFLGLFTCAAGATTTIGTLLSTYRPAVGTTPHGQVFRQSGATFSMAEVAITSAGTIFVSANAAGDVFSANFRIPLGRLP
jgi:hypothetical protein